MNRRGFFARVLGALTAVIYSPPREIDWKTLPSVYVLPRDEREVMVGTYNGINRATFSFWTNQSGPRAMTSIESDAVRRVLEDGH